MNRQPPITPSPALRSPQDLERCLAEELGCAQRLATLLDQEHDALLGDDPERIGALAREKGVLALALESARGKRAALLKACGAPAGGPQLDGWLSRARSKAAFEAWRALAKTARRARAQNDVNGQLITGLQRHLEARLELIVGQAMPRPLYGPDGGRRLRLSSQTLAQA